MTSTVLTVLRPGLVDYLEAWEEQKRLHEGVVAGTQPDTVLLLEHPSVFTAGKRTEPADRPFDGTPVVDVDRGGRITWHGPGQIVGYPILELAPDRRDVHRYVRDLEEVMIRACADFGLSARRMEGLTGAWLGDEKVGAIGVRIARWVTSHGFALNVATDLATDKGFQVLNKRGQQVAKTFNELSNVFTTQVGPALLDAAASVIDLTGGPNGGIAALAQGLGFAATQAPIFATAIGVATLALSRMNTTMAASIVETGS